MRISKWLYYLRSIPLMLRGFTNWTSIPFALASQRGLIIRLSGLRFFYRSALDVWTIKETCLDDLYRLAARPIRARGTVIDIGAGLGDFAIMAARQYPQARVLAFEPFPESAALCRRNIALNQAANVALFEEAIGQQRGSLALDVSSADSVQHSTARAAAGNGGLAVATNSLADIFAEQAIDYCDLLKLDCEGAEFEILLSLDQPLLARIGRISMEYHDGVTAHAHSDLIGLLERAGFMVQRVANPVHADLGYLYAQR
jgi:FkbM family methyltransferase